MIYHSELLNLNKKIPLHNGFELIRKNKTEKEFCDDKKFTKTPFAYFYSKMVINASACVRSCPVGMISGYPRCKLAIALSFA